LSTDPSSLNDVTLADLYQQYQGRLCRYATRLTQDPVRAEDLVQETFLKAMAHQDLLGRLNPYQCRAWLYRVLKNLFLDEQRTHQRRQALIEQLARQVQIDQHPMAMVLSPDWYERVPERYQEVLHMRFFLGMNSKEIGQELGIPAATVRSRIHLAIKWLRTHRAAIL
jgi:RNA polymerase sigma-70 factor (ECF subfamily)